MEIRPAPPTCELRDDPTAPGEGEQCARRSERRDKNAFTHKLTHQQPAIGAERQTGRHVLAALHSPRQEQAGHIRTSDEKQERRGEGRELEEVENPFPAGRDTQRTPADGFKVYSLK